MDIVVIGAGQAGAALVAKLRALGHAGSITLIGDEAAPPYQRPPLSKAYLLGEMEEERLWLRGPDFYAEHGITLKLGEKVSAIEPVTRKVMIGNDVISYDELVLTTGSYPRRLPGKIGGDLAGIYTVRSLADVDAMKPEFAPGRRLVVIGGGYIGLEAAAVGAKLGLDVTVIEMAPRILQRVAAPETSDYFRALHTAHGVKILKSTGLERILGEGRVSGVRLSDGSELPADFIIAGVGILPGTGSGRSGGAGDRQRHQDRRIWPHLRSAYLGCGRLREFPAQGRAVAVGIGGQRH